jgi:hypothetical protein
MQQCSPGGAQRRPSWQCTTAIRTVNKSATSPPDAPTKARPRKAHSDRRPSNGKRTRTKPGREKRTQIAGPATASAHARRPGNLKRTRTAAVRPRRRPSNLQRPRIASVRPHRRWQPASTHEPLPYASRRSRPDRQQPDRDCRPSAASHCRSYPAVTPRLDDTETAPEHSQKDPAAVHRCLNNTETTPEHSQKDPAAVHRCLDGAEAAVSRSRMRVATKGGGGETGTSHIGQQDQHWCWPEVPGQIPAPHQAP